MMTSLNFALYLTCVFLWRKGMAADLKSSATVYQESGFISANVGDKVTLRCVYVSSATLMHWYKQPLGEKPRRMSFCFRYVKEGIFIDEFKSDSRLSMDNNDVENNLTISNLQTSDSATYYCAHGSVSKLKFEEGIIVSVKGSGLNVPALVHQSGSETIQPGGSVNLSCTVHTGTCDGQHSVYWFRNSEESHPGLIYTHGDRSDQCERKPDTQTHTCVYNLTMEDLNISHAGTYYCAVVSCGHIFFGNGTDLKIKGEESSSVVVYLLSAALAITTIVVMFLTHTACRVYKTKSQCPDSWARSGPASVPNPESHQDADSLHYAAIRDHSASRSRRQRDSTSECVYSSVKL